MFGSLGLPEILVLLAILVFVFGARKLPEIGRGLGEGIQNFKKSLKSGAADEESGSKS